MYIALSWLLSLSILMWICLCISDIYIFRELNMFTTPVIKRNISVLKSKENGISFKTTDYYLVLWYGTFSVMTYLTSIVKSRDRIILQAKLKLENLYQYFFKSSLQSNIAYLFKYIICKCIAWSKYVKDFVIVFLNKKNNSSLNFYNVVHITMLKRIKDLIAERRKLGNLLFITVQENKTIKLKYHLETLAKNRFALHISESQKKMKINRSNFLCYQNLYFISHQENIFLKLRLDTLNKAKEKLEKNLLSIVNQVYLSKNEKLKSYCSQFVVQTKDSLMKRNVQDEILAFIERYQSTSNAVSKRHEISKNVLNDSCLENINHRTANSSVKCEGQLRGEYIWAVKDKNGMIQKIYEYKSELNRGEVVRRLREYSVYHIKDSILSNHRALSNTDDIQGQWVSTITNQHFLTDSYVFQRFLRNYNNISYEPAIPIIWK